MYYYQAAIVAAALGLVEYRIVKIEPRRESGKQRRRSRSFGHALLSWRITMIWWIAENTITRYISAYES